MATMPREYWETYERKSPHISGKHTLPRLRISCDWTLIDAAAKALKFPTGSALVMELARLADTSPKKFQALVKDIETGKFERAGIRVRDVRCAEWEKPGVSDAVRGALRRISYGQNDEGAQ